jgi:TolB-like protein
VSTPDIFLSYNREDSDRARHFADAFAAEGLDVWWDVALRSGEAYDEVTENALHDAKAVVVLWSPRSVVSRWVRAEATQAERNKTLVPAMIEPCRRPIMFELTQTAELSHWKGDTRDHAWQEFIKDVRNFVGRENPAPAAAPTPAAKAKPERVLPFLNMGGDPEQEYFADGITEDIITDLSKVSALSVISRNSAFTFKGKHVDIVEVATLLNVDHVLEGSVRKAGNRVRVTAQLIDGMNNDHVWAERFDRDLDDIFALQDELSQEIVKALKVKLVPAEKKAITKRSTENSEAYDLLLRARALHWTMAPDNVARAVEIYRESLALDPDFETALAGLATALSMMGVYDRAYWQAAQEEARRTLAHAVAIAPHSPEVAAAAATLALWAYDWAEVEAWIGRGMQASKGTVGSNMTLVMLALGRAQQSAEMQRQEVRADPLSVGASFALQYNLDAAGCLDDAEREYLRSMDLRANPAMTGWRACTRAMARADHARVRKIYVEEFGDDISFMPFRLKLIDVLDRPADALAVLREALDDPACGNAARLSTIANWAAYFGDNALALAALRKGLVDQKHGVALVDLWFPNLAGVRQEPGFKDILRDIGLVDHWRKTGNWGDFARPLGDDDFEMIA